MINKKTIFITGATGFIGTELINVLSRLPQYLMILLVQDRSKMNFPQNENIQILIGDLLSPETYVPFLTNVDTIIHLAAQTGKSSRESFIKVNIEGTRMLVEAAKRSRVQQFLYMSTIAVKYLDRYKYYYAESKKLAEKIVAESELNFCIVRPTIIVDKRSPNFQMLNHLSQPKVIPLPARLGVKLQPISLDDVINTIIYILEENRFTGEAIDLGGPDRIYLFDFINMLHLAKSDRFPLIVHLPYKLIQKVIGLIESPFQKLLPFSVGQMAPFGNDSITTSSEFFHSLNPEISTTADMLSETLGQPSRGMESVLNAECEIFTNYLLGVSPDDYILEKYRQANNFRGSAYYVECTTLDLVIIQFARVHPIGTKLANTYSNLFAPGSILLRKLTLLLSILEYAPLTHRYFDEINNQSIYKIIFSMIIRGLTYIVILPMSMLFLGPFHLINRRTPPKPGADIYDGKT